MESIIEKHCGQERKKLLLHACCAPCSSHVLDILSEYFKITIYFYNPNITDEEEYNRRLEEQKNLVKQMTLYEDVTIVEGDYEPEVFTKFARNYSEEPEGGERCARCYRLRIDKTAVYAKSQGYDFFSTTLSISPHKDSKKLNDLGKEIAEKYEVDYLFSDFKKGEGYKKSVELSRKYQLYRQDYCGCVYSQNAR